MIELSKAQAFPRRDVGVIRHRRNPLAMIGNEYGGETLDR